MLINKFKSFFGVGSINKLSENSIQYRVSSLKDLTNVVIPHFDEYSLISQKRADFELFKSAVDLMNRGEHLTIEGLIKIVSIRASMNNGLTAVLAEAFPNITPADRLKVETREIVDPNWLAGFTAGEGSFLINIIKSSRHKTGAQVQLRFQITQHSRDQELLKSLIKYLECGHYNPRSGRDSGDFEVTRFSDIESKILPFFGKYPIEGVKALDFSDFKKAVEIMKVGGHLTKDGLDQIRLIKAGMNRGRESLPIFCNFVGRKANMSQSSDLNAKCLFMYNRDKSILYYCTANQREFLDSLNIHNNTYKKHLAKGTYYLGKYLFTGYLVPTAKFKNLSLSELALMLEKDRKSKRKS